MATDYKSIFQQVKDLAERFCFVSGYGTIKKNEVGEYVMSEIVYWDILKQGGEELINEALCDEVNHKVEKDGVYEFEALLSFNAEQRGSYPPPNLECAAYMEIEHIEYKYIEPEHVAELPPIQSHNNEDLPF